MEFLTFSKVYALLQNHPDLLQQYGASNMANQHVKVKTSHNIERLMAAVGELLIRAGTWLKEHSCRRLASEEASAPTFLIML